MLIALGFLLILVGIAFFFASTIGPMSKLWWPDRPSRERPASIPWVMVAIGIGLVALGLMLPAPW